MVLRQAWGLAGKKKKKRKKKSENLFSCIAILSSKGLSCEETIQSWMAGRVNRYLTLPNTSNCTLLGVEATDLVPSSSRWRVGEKSQRP